LDKLNIDDLVILNRNPEYINYINKLIDDKSFMFTDEQLKVLKNPNQFYSVNQDLMVACKNEPVRLCYAG
jgi:hypothetical protein